MKKNISLIVAILFLQQLYAQEPIWSVCVNESKYQYVSGDMDEFEIINKPVTFCYNQRYFGFVTGKDNYIQVFPLERRSYDTVNGYVEEGFINDKSGNYQFGDLLVKIRHGKPQTVFINCTNPYASWAIYIETNSLGVMEYRNKKASK